jgi:hypothetical protein
LYEEPALCYTTHLVIIERSLVYARACCMAITLSILKLGPMTAKHYYLFLNKSPPQNIMALSKRRDTLGTIACSPNHTLPKYKTPLLHASPSISIYRNLLTITAIIKITNTVIIATVIILFVTILPPKSVSSAVVILPPYITQGNRNNRGIHTFSPSLLASSHSDPHIPRSPAAPRTYAGSSPAADADLPASQRQWLPSRVLVAGCLSIFGSCDRVCLSRSAAAVVAQAARQKGYRYIEIQTAPSDRRRSS